MSQDKTERMEYFISLLDDYIDGRLEQGKTDEIEKMIEDDPFYAEVLKQHVQVRSNIRLAGEEELREKFSKQFEPIKPEVKQKSNPFKFLIPALLLLAIAITAYFFFVDQDKSQEKKPYLENINNQEGELLLASVEDPSYDLLRSQEDSLTANSWRHAVQQFIIKDYRGAIEIVSKLESDSSFVADHLGKVSLMKGVSNLKLEQYEDALDALSLVEKGNPYFDQAEWYMALASYYGGDKKDAQNKLQKIAMSSSHYKRDQASGYLKRLAEE